jgi:hypothetical protein
MYSAKKVFGGTKLCSLNRPEILGELYGYSNNIQQSMFNHNDTIENYCGNMNNVSQSYTSPPVRAQHTIRDWFEIRKERLGRTWRLESTIRGLRLGFVV